VDSNCQPKRYSELMADELNEIAEINDCGSLFLTDFQETGRNSLQVQVAEGLPVGSPKSIKVGETEIRDCTAIEITDESRVFKVLWRSYVGYSVLNESYASISDEERYEGNRFRVYSKSRFMQFMSQATFACDEYPGPARHYCIVCESHVLHVLSVEPPTILRIRGSKRSSGVGETANLIQ
jgi:hypothetical protein